MNLSQNYVGGVQRPRKSEQPNSFIDYCAVNEPRAPSGSPAFAGNTLAVGFIRCATISKTCSK